MSSANDSNFILYLSETDQPLAPSERNSSGVNKNFILKILQSEDAVEQALNEGLDSVIQKRLCTNPFLEEDLRCKLFEKQISSNNSEDNLAEICRESYLTHNLQNNCRYIASKTGTLLNWKSLKQESLKRIHEKFIHKNNENCDQATIDEINNKLFINE